MPEDNQSKILNNQQILLLEQAKASRHRLLSCKAAFRLLEGAVLTGLVEAESANEIFINISLISNGSNKRLDYSGINLMQRLMFEIPIKQWILLSFEKAENVRTQHNAQILSKLRNVEIMDYITFLKEVLINDRK